MVVHGRIRRAARQAQALARATRTAREAVRAKAKIGTGVASPKNGKARGVHQHGKEGSINSVDEASDIDWWTQSDGSQSSSQSVEEIRFCMLSKSKVQNQRREVDQKEDAERGSTQDKFKIVQRKHRQRRGVNTHTTDVEHSAFQRPSEQRRMQRNQYTCLTSQTVANGSERRGCRRQRCCGVYDEQEKNAALERRDARITRRNVDMRRRK